jgi:hypothetical protein
MRKARLTIARRAAKIPLLSHKGGLKGGCCNF